MKSQEELSYHLYGTQFSDLYSHEQQIIVDYMSGTLTVLPEPIPNMSRPKVTSSLPTELVFSTEIVWKNHRWQYWVHSGVFSMSVKFRSLRLLKTYIKTKRGGW